jgi:hypothetical protein
MNNTENVKPGSLKRMVSPPDGFRMLIEGERTKRGDVFCIFGKWLPSKGYNAKWNPRQYWPMARRPNDKVSYHADNAGEAHGKDTNDK